MPSRLPGFYRLGLAERRRRLLEAAGLAADGFAAVDPGALSLDVADGMIENVVGTYALPFAVAVNFVVDGAEVLVPMAIEEASVVAAASNAARMVYPAGFITEVSPPLMIGQIQVTDIADVDKGAAALRAHAAKLVEDARNLVPRLAARGGGPVALDVRVLARPPGPDGGVIVAHLHVDCRDAMGANLVNTLCEALAERVAALAGGRPGLRILSNLTDDRTVTARCFVPDAMLAGDNCDGPDVRRAIAAASRFAEQDPYRAATHNKGIMNGIDAVLLATGQDWRALADIQHADRLASVAAAAGIATNLAALRALATEGIQRGHMSLHARGLARAAGATGDLVDRVAAELAASGDVKPDRAREVLARLSKEPP